MTTQEEVYMKSNDRMIANYENGTAMRLGLCSGVICRECPHWVDMKGECFLRHNSMEENHEAVTKWKADHSKPKECTFGELGEGEMFVTHDSQSMYLLSKAKKHNVGGVYLARVFNSSVMIALPDFSKVTRVSIQGIERWRDGEGV